jgi:hypothetical protein
VPAAIAPLNGLNTWARGESVAQSASQPFARAVPFGHAVRHAHPRAVRIGRAQPVDLPGLRFVQSVARGQSVTG